MLFKLPTMYALAKGGKIKQWDVSAEDGVITVTHGYMDGKKQTKLTTCKGKNKGRKNETTAEVQAEKEAQSKWTKQFDKCYRDSIDAAQSVGELLPMLAADYTKVGHRIKFPCEVSPKLDGVRAIANVDNGAEVTLTSRGGKPYPVVKHLKEQLNYLKELSGEERFDGELYIHGHSLQNIVSCVKKDNELTESLEYWIFDLPGYYNDWEYRSKKMKSLLGIVKKHAKELPNIHIVESFVAPDETHARGMMDTFISDGYEGLILRNFSGVYEHNHRSADLQKWKDFKDCEAKVVSVEEDKLGEGILHMEMDGSSLNGGVYKPKINFKCKMRGSHEERLYSEQEKLIGSWVTIKYQAFTDDGVPQFPVAIAVRECDAKGNPTI